MKLEKFKEKNKKKIGIILFTITCILLISGVILYRTFAIFEVNNNLDLINGSVQDRGDIEFAFYIDGDLSKNAPQKGTGYSLDTSSSYCKDVLNGNQVSDVNWNDESWSIEIKNVSTTKTKCYLYFKQIYKESILNGAIPDLGNGRLIPVTISNEEKPSDVTAYTNADSKYGGKVKKADITTSWYSYEKKQWANAVILKDGVVDNYQPGDEIEEKNIESYFVWIPRYKYQLKENESTYDTYSEIKQNFGEKLNNNEIPNKGANDPYEIVFETKNDGSSTGSTKNSWLTHPAFVSFNSNGMWVGKFETGYLGAIDTAGAQKNTQESDKIIIKPNVYSWRKIQVGNAFYTSYEYIRDLESHMIKNTEWGAVFYLTYSEYGRCDENNQNCEEVRINNTENYITGSSAKNAPTCGYTASNETCNKYESIGLNTDGTYSWSYYNPSSQIASTTGNYSGIYDMAGGGWENVMGVVQAGAKNATPSTGTNVANNSGFNGPYSGDSSSGSKTNGLPWPSSKYYDLYDYDTSNTTYQRGHLGDATKEIGPFYSVQYNYNTKLLRYVSSYFSDDAVFIHIGSPWFIRGGDSKRGTDAGLLAFDNNQGQALADGTFRIILTP